MSIRKGTYILTLTNTDTDRSHCLFLHRHFVVAMGFLLVSAITTASILLTRSYFKMRSERKLYALSHQYSNLKSEFETARDKFQSIESILNLQNDQVPVKKLNLILSESKLAAGGKSDRLIRNDLPVSEEEYPELSVFDESLTRFTVSIQKLNDLIALRNYSIATFPSICPVLSGWLSSGFGKRTDPFTDRIENHLGVDIAVRTGTPVYASAAGTVSLVNLASKENTGYGLYVIIDHGNGYQTLYGHLSGIAVKKGDQVKRWDVIGSSGNSGRSTSPHLHYGVYHNGVAQNPVHFFLDS